MENQEMIQALSPHATQKAFATAFGRGVRYGVRRNFNSLVVAIRAKFGPMCGHYLELNIAVFLHMESLRATVVRPKDR